MVEPASIRRVMRGFGTMKHGLPWFGGVPALLMAAAASAALPDYPGVELQARSNLLVNDNGYNLPPGSSFNSISADINASAQVAFRVQVVPDAGDPGMSRPGLWLGAHGNGALVHTGPIDASIDNEACINDNGDIAFTQSDGGVGNSLYLYAATAGSAAAIGTLPVIPNSYGSPCVNAAGDIGFQASFSSGRAYAARVGGVTTIHAADASVSPGSPYTYLYTPSFNDAGTLAAKVATSPDLFTRVEIRTFSSSGSQRILANTATDAASPYSKFDNSLALADNGVIAVIATRTSDNRRVVLRSDGVTTTEIAAVDPIGTIRELDSFAPAINDSGWVVFRARDAGGQAIYLGDGSQLVRVIGNGDVVQTDLGAAQLGQDNATDPVFAGKPSINVHGDIAFVAGVYPQGDNSTEWGSGVFVAYASNDRLFADGFENPAAD